MPGLIPGLATCKATITTPVFSLLLYFLLFFFPKASLEPEATPSDARAIPSSAQEPEELGIELGFSQDIFHHKQVTGKVSHILSHSWILQHRLIPVVL